MGGRSGKIRPRKVKTPSTLKGGVAESKISVEDQTRFLEALVACHANVRKAADRSRINRTTHYGWLNRDPSYRIRYETARQMVLDDLESTLFEKSDLDNNLLRFTLERKFPEKYGRRLTVEGSVTQTALDPKKLQALFTEPELVLFREFSKRASGAKVGG